MEGSTTGRDTWTRWVLWTTGAEVTGFVTPEVFRQFGLPDELPV